MKNPTATRTIRGIWAAPNTGSVETITEQRMNTRKNVSNSAAWSPNTFNITSFDEGRDSRYYAVGEVGQKRQHEGPEEKNRHPDDDDLRYEGQGRLLDLGHSLQDRDHQAGDQAKQQGGGADQHGHQNGIPAQAQGVGERHWWKLAK